MTHLKMQSHLSDSSRTTTNLNKAWPLDSPILSSELQDNSSLDSVEIEFLPESEGQLDHVNISPTDVFFEHVDNKQFLLRSIKGD